MREAIQNAVGAVETWISDDIGIAMNRYNINPNPKPRKERKEAQENAERENKVQENTEQTVINEDQ